MEAMQLQAKIWEQQSDETRKRQQEEQQKESKRRDEDKKKVIAWLRRYNLEFSYNDKCSNVNRNL